MDLEARDEHEAKPLLGNFGQNKLATAADKQGILLLCDCAKLWVAFVDPCSCSTVHVHGGPLFGESLLALALPCCDDSSFFSSDGKPLGDEELQTDLATAARQVDSGICSQWPDCRLSHLLLQHGVLLPL